MKKLIDNDKYEMYLLIIAFRDSYHYTNSYIIKEKESNLCMVIDPADNSKYIQECIESINGVLDSIYLTHCHLDHTLALDDMYNMYQKETKPKIYIHENDVDGIFDNEKCCRNILGGPEVRFVTVEDITKVKEQDKIKLGKVEFEVVHTPGHTSGSSILYEEINKILITGDTLFSDCYGRTDLKSGSIIDMKNSLNKIFTRFNPDTVIFPGHGDEGCLKDARRRVEVLISFI